MEWLDHKVAFIFPYLSVTGHQHELGCGSSAEPVLKRTTSESCPSQQAGIWATHHGADSTRYPSLPWQMLPCTAFTAQTSNVGSPHRQNRDHCACCFAEPRKQDQLEVLGNERSPPSNPLAAFNHWLLGENKHPQWYHSDMCALHCSFSFHVRLSPCRPLQ